MKTDKIKLLALDLDGTTLRSNNTLSDEVADSLKTLIKSGVEVIAASGRPYRSMPEKIINFDGINYFITSNGAAAYDKKGNRIFRELLDENAVVKFLELTKDYDLIFDIVIDGATNTDIRYLKDPIKFGCPDAYVDYVRISKNAINDTKKFIYENRSRIDGIQIVSSDREFLHDLQRLVLDNIDDIFITSSADNFIELSSPKATKANALDFMCKKLGVDVKNCAACGNADNDANMISFAGLGAAVKNACCECLEVADLIVADNDSNGVCELVERILDINEAKFSNH